MKEDQHAHQVILVIAYEQESFLVQRKSQSM